MVKVTLNGTTLAESTETVVVENNHYFPPSAYRLSVEGASEKAKSIEGYIAFYKNKVQIE
ncbi:hypothetical protein C0995_013859 [Termitomyces sp. Mi166|nr:hypothetical protein C0995_013859 [Termitomyces sp. Mi166\